MRCECGDSFELSARNVRVHRANGTDPKCPDCRYGRSRPIKVTQAMRDYWLKRFTISAIRELASCLDTLAGSDREHAAWD